MRPPKLKWQKTADALVQLFEALEVVAGSLGVASAGLQTTGEVVRALADARTAVASLQEHVAESEECEMD